MTDLQLQPARNEIACPEGWPWEGRVEFRRVFASHGKSLFEHHLRGKSIEPRTKIAPRGHISTPVLRNVSFNLEGGQKLGICGRTGR